MSIWNVGKRLGCWSAVGGLLFLGICLSGCRTQPQAQQFAEVPSNLAAAPSASPVSASATVPATASAALPTAVPAAVPGAVSVATNSSGSAAEVLRVGDSLTITFTDTPVPIPTFDEKIKEDGTITLTQNKTFKADGKTRGGLEKEIRACYVPNYYKYMTVSVKQQESTRWYYVNGEVKMPNRQIYTSRLTLLQAIASTGGFTDFANKKKVKLTRVDGRTQIVNCVKALENPSLDPEIYPCDTIHVPRRLW
jgi:protein involved in polysaccharide export with SLBB domain